MLINQNKITEIFCMADDFCKVYDTYSLTITASGAAKDVRKSCLMFEAE